MIVMLYGIDKLNDFNKNWTHQELWAHPGPDSNNATIYIEFSVDTETLLSLYTTQDQRIQVHLTTNSVAKHDSLNWNCTC